MFCSHWLRWASLEPQLPLRKTMPPLNDPWAFLSQKKINTNYGACRKCVNFRKLTVCGRSLEANGIGPVAGDSSNSTPWCGGPMRRSWVHALRSPYTCQGSIPASDPGWVEADRSVRTLLRVPAYVFLMEEINWKKANRLNWSLAWSHKQNWSLFPGPFPPFTAPKRNVPSQQDEALSGRSPQSTRTLIIRRLAMQNLAWLPNSNDFTLFLKTSMHHSVCWASIHYSTDWKINSAINFKWTSYWIFISTPKLFLNFLTHLLEQKFQTCK